MQKGQISIDLLVTLLAAIAVITVISTVIFTYSESQERLNAEQKLLGTTEQIASLITAGQILSDTTYTIEYTSTKIFYTDSNKNYRSQYPLIEFTSQAGKGKVSAAININGKEQQADANYFAGDTTTITYASGKTVITNEQ